MRFSRLKIENFRAIDSLDVELHPNLNVLVGGNASGKTSVLDAIVRAYDWVQTEWFKLSVPGKAWSANPVFLESDIRKSSTHTSVRLEVEGNSAIQVDYDKNVTIQSNLQWPDPTQENCSLPLLIHFDTRRAAFATGSPFVVSLSRTDGLNFATLPSTDFRFYQPGSPNVAPPKPSKSSVAGISTTNSPPSRPSALP